MSRFTNEEDQFWTKMGYAPKRGHRAKRNAKRKVQRIARRIMRRNLK